ncbi:MAG: hypothetical protein UT05_C0009G0070 [Parcubacteria group bacterium GW2011_GWF2_38_76]|nr:MAG: hypothetical protein UT05_C0009G0070 [Parcubacteria group bacterium GW2011_GWF2_38_76]HBM45511.1 hypothetical protein [Patescibacteria group bacterium]
MVPRKDILKSSGKLRRKKKFDNFLIFLSIFLFIFTSLAGLSQIDRFLIKKIKIRGERTLSSDIIAPVILEEMSGKFLGFFPKNNFLIFKKTKIIENIKKNFLVINNVSLSLSDINTLVVEIEERQANFIWCEKEKTSCFYLNSEGLIFNRAPGFSKGVFFRFEGGLPLGKEPSYYLGKFIIPTEYFKMLNTFKQRAEDAVKNNFSDKWKATSYFLKEGDDLELFFENKEEQKWKIILAPRKEEEYSFKGGDAGGVLSVEKEKSWIGFGNDLELAERNLSTILSSKAFKDSANGETDPLQDLEYIDLRFGKKIFYKFTN